MDSPSLTSQVKLSRVLGLTVSSNGSLSSHTASNRVAYPAGCVTVLLDVKRNKQSHIVSPSKKSITSLSFAPDGKHVITGESGHQPSVRIWDTKTSTQVAEFLGHKYEITCVAFSPDNTFAVSIGSQHDMMVNVWDWKAGVKVASNKVSAKVKALSFCEEGNHFVTVGVRHVKFWYLDYSRPRTNEAVPLMGRSAILGNQRNNNFVDVGCGRGPMKESTFAVTESGLLCEFNARRLLDKWVELRTTKAYSLSVGEEVICIGCADGIVRIFNPANLHFICTLPRPHALGTDLVTVSRSDPSSYNASGSAKYGDTIGVTLMEDTKKVACVYSDHSLYVWDIQDPKRVGKSQSYLFHSGCIWGVESYKCPDSNQSILPPGSFVTCSADDTVRVWNIEDNVNLDPYSFGRNIFSNELLKIYYMDPDLKFLCNQEVITANGTNNNNGSNTDAPSPETTYDGKNGVRCLKISPDGRHLASGDRSGNIRVKDLLSNKDVCKIEAHDSEVLSLEYSDPSKTKGFHGSYFLSSASRDRLIHVFDVKQKYTFVQTLDEHNSAITAIKFVRSSDDSLQLLSCGADKSIFFRRMNPNNNQSDPRVTFNREHHVVGKCTLYDMELDMAGRVLTACQDRQIRVYGLDNGKLTNTLKGCHSEEGTLIKLAMDPSGSYYATSSTDKTLNIMDYSTGDCIAVGTGHSELITGLTFSPNGRSLISVSGDGCIFVWTLPPDVANTISGKLGLPPVPPEKPAFIQSLRLPKHPITIMDPEKPMNKTMEPVIPIVSTTINLNINGKLNDNPNDSDTNSVSSVKASSLSSSSNASSTSSMSNKWRKESDSDIRSRSFSQSNDMSLSERDRSDVTQDTMFYPQDDESLQRSSFEVKVEKSSLSGSTMGSSSSLSQLSLKNSMSVPNFNDLHSDDEHTEDSSQSSSRKDRDRDRDHDRDRVRIPAHQSSQSSAKLTLNPLYMSQDNLNQNMSDRKGDRKYSMSNNRHSIHSGLGEGDVNRTSLSTQHHRPNLASATAHHLSALNATFPSGDDSMMHHGLTRSTSVTSVSGLRGTSRRREELTKAVSEAKRKLESLGWKNNLSNSKSVADLRLMHRPQRPTSFNPASSNSVPRSCSMSDLSFGPRRILNQTMNAPLWERSGSQANLNKSSSITSLNTSHHHHHPPASTSNTLSKIRNRSLSKGVPSSSGPWGTPSPLYIPNQTSGRRSGRASAPLQRGRVHGSSQGTQSSDDESESSDDESTFMQNLRPGTPPKPSILRQVRRSSTSSNLVPNSLGAGGSMASGPFHHNQHHKSTPKSRKLWDNFELRSSKSEYNLSLMGSTPNHHHDGSVLGSVSRTGSRLNLSNWDNKVDLQSSNPATIELTSDVCAQVAEELQFMAIFARKLFKRAQSAGVGPLCDVLSDGVIKTQHTLNTVSNTRPVSFPATKHNGAHFTPTLRSATEESPSSLPPDDAVMNVLQQYSDKLLSMVQQRMHDSPKH